MILPTKYIKEDESLLGLGAIILNEISSKGEKLTSIWDSVKDNENIFNFERFILTLDMLYILGLIDMKNNEIIKVQHNDI